MQGGRFSALLAFMRGSEEVGKIWSGKQTDAGGRRSSAREGLERRVFSTSAGTRIACKIILFVHSSHIMLRTVL